MRQLFHDEIVIACFDNPKANIRHTLNIPDLGNDVPHTYRRLHSLIRKAIFNSPDVNEIHAILNREHLQVDFNYSHLPPYGNEKLILKWDGTVEGVFIPNTK